MTSSKQEQNTSHVRSVEKPQSAFGSKQPKPLPPLFQSILEAALELRVAAKKPTSPRRRLCPDPQVVTLQDQKRSSLPNDAWQCLDCGEKEKLYVILEPGRSKTKTLLTTDLVVCETCGFRMYGKTMNAWYHGQGKPRKKRGGRAKELTLPPR